MAIEDYYAFYVYICNYVYIYIHTIYIYIYMQLQNSLKVQAFYIHYYENINKKKSPCSYFQMITMISYRKKITVLTL